MSIGCLAGAFSSPTEGFFSGFFFGPSFSASMCFFDNKWV